MVCTKVKYKIIQGNGVSCLIGSPYIAIEFFTFDKYNKFLKSIVNYYI